MSISLPHGCRIGKIGVFPKNWQESSAPADVSWFIHYRYYDPNYAKKYPKGFPVQLRGMNAEKTATIRRQITRGLIENEIRNLEAGYNPILKKTVHIELNDIEILPSCPFILALEKAYGFIPDIRTKKEICKALSHITRAIRQLRYDRLKISEVRRRHLISVLEKIARDRRETTGREWGAHSWNHYRAYMLILFRQLDRLEAVELDLKKIEKKRTIKRLRKTLSDEQFTRVDEAIRNSHYTFWRFIHIFFHSCARMSEMMQVRARDVDLSRSQFIVTVRKGGGQIEEVLKTITATTQPLWEEAVREAIAGDYLFSKGLRPGPTAINEHQVTKRWRVHVKKKLDIEADFYSLKHKYTTEVVSKALEKIEAAQLEAATKNGHKGAQMVKKHYDTEGGERLHRELRVV